MIAPSPSLQDLLTHMREHPAFRELLNAVEPPLLRSFKASEDVQRQNAEWIFRSGARHQDAIWRQFLTNSEPSQQEKT